MKSMDTPLVTPESNFKAYYCLYQIEVGLRELVIELLEGKSGPRWWKTRLPQDVMTACKSGLRYERSKKWLNNIPHHPVYYVEFPDLRKIIDRNDNWNEVFKVIFQQKENILPLLMELEPIRNAIAHNRKITNLDQGTAERALEKIQLLITPQNFSRLVSRCSMAHDIPSILANLHAEAELTYELASAVKPISDLPNWSKVERSWWYDLDYLLNETRPITDFFTKMTEYRFLSRERGTGHNIESWLKTSLLDELHFKAIEALRRILGTLK